MKQCRCWEHAGQELSRKRGSLSCQGPEVVRETCDISEEGGKKTRCLPSQRWWSWRTWALQKLQCDWSTGAAALRGVGELSRTNWVESFTCMHGSHIWPPTLFHLFLQVKLRQGSLNNPPVVFSSSLQMLNPMGRCSRLSGWCRNCSWRPGAASPWSLSGTTFRPISTFSFTSSVTLKNMRYDLYSAKFILFGVNSGPMKII